MRRREELSRIFRIKTLIDNINKIEKLAIIVEGVTDKDALKLIGIEKQILVYNDKRFWEKLFDIFLTHQRILVLTDFDREGESLNTKIAKRVDEYGIMIMEKLRRKFRMETRGMGHEIYEIARSIYRLQKDYFG